MWKIPRKTILVNEFLTSFSWQTPPPQWRQPKGQRWWLEVPLEAKSLHDSSSTPVFVKHRWLKWFKWFMIIPNHSSSFVIHDYSTFLFKKNLPSRGFGLVQFHILRRHISTSILFLGKRKIKKDWDRDLDVILTQGSCQPQVDISIVKRSCFSLAIDITKFFLLPPNQRESIVELRCGTSKWFQEVTFHPISRKKTVASEQW